MRVNFSSLRDVVDYVWDVSCRNFRMVRWSDVGEGKVNVLAVKRAWV